MLTFCQFCCRLFSLCFSYFKQKNLPSLYYPLIYNHQFIRISSSLLSLCFTIIMCKMMWCQYTVLWSKLLLAQIDISPKTSFNPSSIEDYNSVWLILKADHPAEVSDQNNHWRRKVVRFTQEASYSLTKTRRRILTLNTSFHQKYKKI